MPPRPESIISLSIQIKYSFLTFVDNKLTACEEIFARVLPDEGLVVAFVFDDFGDGYVAHY
jgi:hypothetical protein